MSIAIKINDIVTVTSQWGSKFEVNQKVRIVDRIGSYSFYAEDLDNVLHAKVYRYCVWKNPIEKLKLL